MQIKRFEATDMTEALRMVKREFGDDAVILSAKEVRPGGFFSALRKKSVEITAATDYSTDEANSGDDFRGMLSRQLEADTETDRVSLSTTPIIRPFSPKAPSLADNEVPAADPVIRRPFRRDALPEEKLPAGDLTPVPASLSASSVEEAPALEWGGYMTRNHLVAEPFYRCTAPSTVIAMVGPSGVGKSTTVAKLAWRCRTIEKKRTGLISLDRFRIGANAMLERVAQIMNLPFFIVHDTVQLESALNDLADTDVILIDTPGMSAMEAGMRDDIRTLMRSASPDEIHLVASATVRDDALAAAVNAFSPFGADHLLFTHMDEYIASPSTLTLLKKIGLPVSFYADGVDLFDGLKEASLHRPAGLSPQAIPSGGQMAAFNGTDRTVKPAADPRDDNGAACLYVANRNSELFHKADCKSVKRINVENITAFNSIEEAMDKGFKPCRACCNIRMIGKPVKAPLGTRRTHAI